MLRPVFSRVRPRATSRTPDILLLTSDFPPDLGGIATYQRTLYSALPHGPVRVVAPRRAQARRVEGFEFFTYRPRRHMLLDALSMAGATLRAVRRRRPDALHCGSLVRGGAVALMLRPFLGLPYLVYAYGTDVCAKRPQYLTALAGRILARADRVVAVSEYTRALAIDAGADPARTTVVNPAVDAAGFEAAAPPPRSQPPTLLTVARLVERKGHDVALDAVALARRDVPDLEYVIVGDGPLRGRLEAKARALGLEDVVRFTGNVPDVRPYYGACTAFVMPSRTLPATREVEGFGIAFVEASAAGRPVIAGRSGGVADAVIDGVTGVLVDPEDAAALARAIVAIVRDPERAEQLGRQGREHVVETLDPHRAAGQLAELMEAMRKHAEPESGVPLVT